jgi:hypothetical protein
MVNRAKRKIATNRFCCMHGLFKKVQYLFIGGAIAAWHFEKVLQPFYQFILAKNLCKTERMHIQIRLPLRPTHFLP